MACGTNKFELTPTAKKVLNVIKETSLIIDDIAKKTELPLFKVRSNIRNLTNSDFVVLKNNKYIIAPQVNNLI